MVEREAVRTALRRAQPRDLVLVFASKINDVWKVITSFQPEESSVPASGSNGSETANDSSLQPVAMGANNS
jgi:hypothetical protein